MEIGPWRVDRGSAWLATALLWGVVLLMVLPEGLDYARIAAGANVGGVAVPRGGEGGAVTRLLWLSLCSGGLILVVRRIALAREVLIRTNPWFGVALLLALVSLGWSIDTALSLRRLFRLFTILVCLLGFMLVHWRADRLGTALRIIITAVLGGSLVFGALFPAYAIHGESSPELLGAWRGLASHKNAFGGLAALGCLLWLQAGVAGVCSRRRTACGLLVSASCLWLSRSSTSMLAAVLVGGYVLAFARRPANHRSLLRTVSALFLTLGLVAGLGTVNLLPGWHTLSSPFTFLAGKDASLTGRTAIWSLVREHVSRRPLLGSGFGAYWEPGRRLGSESGALLSHLGGFYPGTAHNGYLDVANDLGFAGLFVLLAFIVRHARESLRLAAGDWFAGVASLAVLLQQCVTNLSESHWLNVTSVDFVFMSAFALAVARQRLQLEFVTRFGTPGEFKA